MAVHDRRDNQARFARGLGAHLMQKREPEIEVLVVFAHNDFLLTYAVDLEYTDVIRLVMPVRRQLARCLKAKQRYSRITDCHQRGDPARRVGKNKSRQYRWVCRRAIRQWDRVRVGEVGRLVDIAHARQEWQRHRRYGVIVAAHMKLKIRTRLSRKINQIGRQAFPAIFAPNTPPALDYR